MCVCVCVCVYVCVCVRSFENQNNIFRKSTNVVKMQMK